jgi:hypothetical protein
MLHHDFPPPLPLPSNPSPPTLDDNEYISALEKDDTDESMSEEGEEEKDLPPCGPLQATLSFELAHMESTRRAVRVVVLEQTNAAIDAVRC